jgi:hypothetical protein
MTNFLLWSVFLTAYFVLLRKLGLHVVFSLLSTILVSFLITSLVSVVWATDRVSMVVAIAAILYAHFLVSAIYPERRLNSKVVTSLIFLVFLIAFSSKESAYAVVVGAIGIGVLGIAFGGRALVDYRIILLASAIAIVPALAIFLILRTLADTPPVPLPTIGSLIRDFSRNFTYSFFPVWDYQGGIYPFGKVWIIKPVLTLIISALAVLPVLIKTAREGGYRQRSTLDSQRRAVVVFAIIVMVAIALVTPSFFRERFIFLIGVFWALLAGFGMERLWKSRHMLQLCAVVLVSVALTYFHLGDWRSTIDSQYRDRFEANYLQDERIDDVLRNDIALRYDIELKSRWESRNPTRNLD